jgi:polysaccharide deacetylase family protein (PEP-CTERM system associated)
MRIALTFDVEELAHAAPRLLEGRRDRAGRGFAEELPGIAGATDRLLELLAGCGARATFFVVGESAARMPEVIRRIGAAGHELGVHGWTHRVLYELSPAAFREELRRTRGFREELAGRPVELFRAPLWSLERATRWAVAVLLAEGFAADSSLMPLGARDTGGPHWLAAPDGRKLFEYPPAVWEVGPFRCPCAGGFFFRALPDGLSLAPLRRLARSSWPPLVYLHPWELDETAGAAAGVWRRLPLELRLFFGLRWGSPAARLRRLLAGAVGMSLGQVRAAATPAALAALPVRPAAELRGCRVLKEGLRARPAGAPSVNPRG